MMKVLQMAYVMAEELQPLAKIYALPFADRGSAWSPTSSHTADMKTHEADLRLRQAWSCLNKEGALAMQAGSPDAGMARTHLVPWTLQ